jgi:tetratricopeptide (TPR) repeat protein
MRRAFVSHSTADDSYVAEMESFLRAAGFDEVFNDDSSIRPDEQFWPAIEKGIANCDTLVVVITAASMDSEWVKREVEYARSLSKDIIPLRIEDCSIPSAFDGRRIIELRPRARQERRFDISRIVKYAPAELIGREDETSLLNDAWQKVLRVEKDRPHLLTFFGDDADRQFAASSAGAFEKGQRLARIVGQRRSLLILDGLEPLQYAPTSPTPGQLKDQGIVALLKGLAAASRGLCVVTTRYSLPDLRAFWQTTAPEVNLLRLSREAGVHLLKTLGVRGTAQEFATLVEDVKGHALTLTLLGGFLKRAFHGDIRRRDRVKFEKADEKMDGGHAFRTMAAYEQWLLRDGGDEGQREVAVLRLMGLFDRPADAGCLAALRSETIPGLTEPLAGLADDDWEYCLSGLEAAKLLTVNRDASGALVSLDAHPHLREYFARQLRTQQPDAWRAAHRRLYEHLCATTPDKPQPTLEDLQPLYQALAHGCHAELHQEALDNVYRARIARGVESYGLRKLGAYGSELGGAACFFDSPWSRVSPALRESDQALIIFGAAFFLRALGRLVEAVEPQRKALELAVKANDWKNAVNYRGNLGELELTLGEVAQAVRDLEQAVIYADRSGDADERMMERSSYANALHQAGRRAEAEVCFGEVERMNDENHSDDSRFFSFQGFRYCDLLLTMAERAAWQHNAGFSPAGSAGVPPGGTGRETPLEFAAGTAALLESCRTVSERAAQAIKIAEDKRWLENIALDHLTMGRAALYSSIIENSEIRLPHLEIDHAVSGLRRAGTQWFLPLGLLTRAWLRFLIGARTGAGSAQEDLDEAGEIAERGSMKLFLADIHLHRARLFFREAQYPWKSPQDDLAAAEKLINDCGYHRRDEELADAKAAILSR